MEKATTVELNEIGMATEGSFAAGLLALLKQHMTVPEHIRGIDIHCHYREIVTVRFETILQEIGDFEGASSG